MSRFIFGIALVFSIASCGDSPESPIAPSELIAVLADEMGSEELAAAVRDRATTRGLLPMPPGPDVRPELAQLGRCSSAIQC